MSDKSEGSKSSDNNNSTEKAKVSQKKIKKIKIFGK